MSSSSVWVFDLADNILLFLGLDEDQQTLSACSLVCKAWHMPASRLLFRTIRFHRHIHSKASNTPMPQYADLVSFLRSCERARPYVQTLFLRQATTNTHSALDGSMSEPQAAAMPMEMLEDLINMLPNLRTLCLGVGGSFHVCVSRQPSRTLSSSRIERLVFGDILGSRGTDILTIIFLFRRVGELLVSPFLRQPHGDQVLRGLPAAPPLSDFLPDEHTLLLDSLSLQFQDASSLQSHFLRSLLTTLPTPRLRIRRLRCFVAERFDGLEFLEHFLQLGSAELEDIGVRLFSSNVNIGFLTPLNGMPLCRII